MPNKILVIGATRGTGKAVVERSIVQGDSITVMARDISKAKTLFGDTVNIIQGDVTHPESLATVLTSTFDAVIYTVDITGGIGGRGFFASRQQIDKVVYGGVVNVVHALKGQGFKNQFILLTTLGLENRSLIINLLNLIKPGVIQASIDKATYLIQSGLPYTIVQAGALHNLTTSKEPLTISVGDIPMRLNYEISRQHLAQILIATINNPIAIDKIFNVYGGQSATLSKTDIDRQFENLR
jgi:NAD(P)-dependent dehydrogenase (short-subunit alcohol dehydrogenase family)